MASPGADVRRQGTEGIGGPGTMSRCSRAHRPRPGWPRHGALFQPAADGNGATAGGASDPGEEHPDGHRRGSAARRQYRAARPQRSNSSAHRCRPTCERISLKAGQARDAQELQQLLDAPRAAAVHINPEARVKVDAGPAPAVLQQAGYTPVLVKVINESGGTAAAAHRQPAIGTGVRRHGEALGRAHAAAAPARERERRATHRSVSRPRDVHRGADDGRTLSGLERRVRGRADLLERSGAARGDDHVRRRAGHAGSRLSRGSRRCCSRSSRRSP